MTPNYLRNPVVTGFWAVVLMGGIAAYVADSRAENGATTTPAPAGTEAKAVNSDEEKPVPGGAQPVRPSSPGHSDDDSANTASGSDPLKPAEIKPDVDPMAMSDGDSVERGGSEPVMPSINPN